MAAPYILVIDDVELMTDLASAILEGAGYRVRAINDPRVAMLEIGRQRPDLIVLDVEMPSVSGLDLLRMIRAEPGVSTIPVLMVTAQGQTQRIVASFGEGASDYLFKPYDHRDLIERVRRLLTAARRAA